MWTEKIELYERKTENNWENKFWASRSKPNDGEFVVKKPKTVAMKLDYQTKEKIPWSEKQKTKADLRGWMIKNDYLID